MLSGILMLMGAGMGWAYAGGLISYTARRRVAVVMLMSIQGGLALLLALLLLPDYRVLAATPPGLGTLVALMLSAGCINACGMLILQRAMHCGHHGVAWTIGQSSLVLPFLVGVLFFDEPVSLLRSAGVAAIVGSLVLFGNRRSQSATQPATKGPAGLLWALAALLILGTTQTVQSLPSHLPLFNDTAGIRVPLLLMGNLVVYLLLWARRPVRPDQRSVLVGGIGAILSIGSSFLLFKGLDRLATVQMASIGFPVAVGTCILVFTLYSLVVMRETCTPQHLGGIVLVVAGIVGIAL